MKIYYKLFSRPIKIAPYFGGLQKFASLEQLETGLYKIPVKIKKIIFGFNPVFCIIVLYE